MWTGSYWASVFWADVYWAKVGGSGPSPVGPPYCVIAAQPFVPGAHAAGTFTGWVPAAEGFEPGVPGSASNVFTPGAGAAGDC